MPNIPDNETLSEPMVDVTEDHKARDTIEVSFLAARSYDPGLGTFISADPAMDGLN